MVTFVKVQGVIKQVWKGSLLYLTNIMNIFGQRNGMMKTMITVWKIYNKDKDIYQHNHVEDGHSTSEYPLPKQLSFQSQKSWKSMKWQREFGYLDKGIIWNETL